MKEQFCCVQYLLVFRLISTLVKDWSPAGDGKIIGYYELCWCCKSLWPHKVGARGEIYSARWKLILISDQAKDLKTVFRRRGAWGLRVSFSTTGLHPGSWIIDCASREKFPRDDLCGDSANFKEWFDDISPVLSVEISWVVFGSVVKVVAKVVYCVVYRRCWQTKLSWSQVCSWARVTRGICAKHKNAWWVFSVGDFVLESLFCAQRLWI